MLDLIPYVGIIANLVQAAGGEAVPDAQSWAVSGGSTAAAWAAARAILALQVWDAVVDRTDTEWDNLLLRAARAVLAVLAAKPSERLRGRRAGS